MKANSNFAMFLLLMALFLDVMGFGIIIPVLPRLIRELTGGTVSEASAYGGWLMFAFSLPLFLFSPMMGNLSDRFGRRPVLLISILGLGLDCILQGLAVNMYWLFIGRIIAGIMGASFAIVNSYIADVTEPEKRAEKFGLVGAAFGLGFIFGPLLGGIVSPLGSRVPFFVAASLSIINFILAFFFLPESLSKEDRREFNFKKSNPISSLADFRFYPNLYGLFVTVLLLNIAHQAVRTTWSFYVIERFEWQESTVGLSLAAVGLMYAIVQGGLIGIILKFLGEQKTLFIGFTLYIIGNILFGIASQGWMMFLFIIPYSLGGMEEPAIQAILSRDVPANEQGRLQGLIMSLISISSILGPPLMTEIFHYYTANKTVLYIPGAPLFLGAFLTFICLFLAYFSLKKMNKTV
jgi:MFS transporter, DHA1 family, tetracycline resistance protein